MSWRYLSSGRAGSELNYGEFRLVEVSCPGSRLIINRIAALLNDPPSYAILSYAWSSKGANVEVELDNEYASIRSNLAEALTTFLKKEPHKLIWVDFFCLRDYGDVTGDPLLIPRLFQTSQLSILWAGAGNALRKVAFDLVLKLASARKDVFQDSESDLLTAKADSIVRQQYRERLLSVGLVEWKALDELLGEPFFSRVWVMQEVIASQNPMLWCGEFEIRWQTFCYALEAYASYSFPNLLRSPGVQMVLNAESVRRRRSSGRSVSLYRILEATRGLQADREETKVVAALSTHESLKSHLVKLDFRPGLDLEDGSRLVAKAINNSAQGAMTIPSSAKNFSYGQTAPFLSLSLAQDNENRSKIRGIPSWVPDWTEPLLVYRLNSLSSTFNASKGQKLEVYRYQTYSPARGLNYDALVFKAYPVDVLERVASYMPPRLAYDKYNLNGANSFFFIEWFDWAETSGIKSGDELLLEYAETIQAKGCKLWQNLGISDSSKLLEQARSWLKYFDDETQIETEEIRQFYAACLPAHGRRFGLTTHGNFCLIPRNAAPGDLICIPFGSKVPFVFRKKGSYFENIGECYVHGIMHGEALEDRKLEELEIILH